jgi:CPA1 family monovalent cation:H+ antiporter
MTSWIAAANPRGAPTDVTCSHLSTIAEVQPSTTEGCEDCLREGTSWVHLRECLECGHVGCCDNSPRRHATAHWHTSQHPIMRSFEPGEQWGWCYPDEVFLVHG